MEFANVQSKQSGIGMFLKVGILLATLPLAWPISSGAQTFNLLHSFSGTDGSNPYAGLVQGTGGHLFGNTSGGGAHSGGTVFKISTGGTFTPLYSFCNLGSCADGTDPRGPLVEALNGKFYGTTYGGGPYNSPGTIFEITSSGALTTLYTFCSLSGCTDGGAPIGGLVQALNRTLYGTTSSGGMHGNGTVFGISVSGGTPAKLYDFCSVTSLGSCLDGDGPEGTLIQGTDNKLYGTTFGGGTFSYDGTLFSITTASTPVFTSLHSFDATDGAEPVGGMFQAASDGNFYGTTQTDGKYGYGTVFQLTPLGALNTIYDFCKLSACADGSIPEAGLIQGNDGNLYGTTFSGGNFGFGTVFSITIGGVLTTLYHFDNVHGAQPWGGLVQDTNGTFYGTTYSGGASNLGTVYSVAPAVPLGPFVKVQPPAAKATGKAKVHILGTNLSGTSSVTLCGISLLASSWTVNSNFEITATVPASASVGPCKVEVVTPGGPLDNTISGTYPTFRIIK
jgi:uncharacterized repeat protein (TIGR03803 family)